MKKNNLLVFGILLVLALPFLSAEVNSLGEVDRGSSIILRQVCSSCSYVNISVVYGSNILINNQPLINNGSGLWVYEFTQTDVLGEYHVSGVGDLDGEDTTFSILSFDVVQPKSLRSALYVDYNSPFYIVAFVLLVLGIVILLFFRMFYFASALSIFLGLSLFFSGVHFIVSLIPVVLGIMFSGGKT